MGIVAAAAVGSIRHSGAGPPLHVRLVHDAPGDDSVASVGGAVPSAVPIPHCVGSRVAGGREPFGWGVSIRWSVVRRACESRKPVPRPWTAGFPPGWFYSVGTGLSLHGIRGQTFLGSRRRNLG